MILIKAYARARERGREEFRKLKNAAKFEGKHRASFLSRTREFRADDRLSCVCFLVVQHRRVYHAKSAAACGVTAVTRRAKFSIVVRVRRGRGERERNARKMPGVEDVERRDASHSIIISLPAFPKDCTVLARIQSNAISD